VNTYGDLLDSVADISYMNAVPIRVIHRYRESGFSNSALWRMIAQAYDLSLKPLDKLFRKGLLLSNSSFMQEIMKKHLNRDSMIVYPPVDVKEFQSSKTSSHRENLVATVARLRPGKNLNIIPAMAQVVKEAQFVVLGLADQASKEAVRTLSKTIERLGVEDRVSLLVNQPFQILVDVLSSAKVFLHTQPMEAFGISVVESMAAGCVPVVPRAGGPWLDILAQKEGVYGFSYGSLKEAANRIKMLLEDNALRVDVSTRAMTRALEFDSAVFERRFLYVVEKLLSSR
jgi:glycosyltransferase involved in cell wall biosynthesis